MGRLWAVFMLSGVAVLAAGAVQAATQKSPPCNDTLTCQAPGLPPAVWVGSFIFLVGLVLLGRTVGRGGVPVSAERGARKQ